MKNWYLLLFCMLILFSSHQSKEEDWGFFAHGRINRMAVFTLPPEVIVFYKKNIEYVTKHAIDPDKRRYISQQEAPRHYIDLDHYGEYPFENVPRKWLGALSKFTKVFVINTQGDTLQLFGDPIMNFDQDTLVLKNKAIQYFFKKDSVCLSKDRYITFVNENINAQFYELDWKISPKNLDTLFQVNQIFEPQSKAYAEDYLSNYGIVPWHLERMKNRLTRAFKENNQKKILKISSDIGHYIGDAHVPLHTTENYNGQLTNQVGIHGFWESRLPELFASDYSYFVGKSNYIKNPNEYFWDMVLTSHLLVDSVLFIEKDLTNQFPSDLKYCYETRGNQTIRTYCKDFSDAYHQRLKGMVESRMQAAILSVGSVWYSAWVDAGQPDLRQLMDIDKESEVEEKIAIEGKKIKGRQHD